MANNLIAQIANEFVSGNTSEVVDIISFIEAPWGLGFRLYPQQTFVLKCTYGLPLDNSLRNIEIPDIVNEKILYKFTETEFLHYLYEEGRCNTNEVEGKNFSELVFVIGRRGSKSVMASCVSSYELYKLIKYGDPSQHFKLLPGSEIAILNVAPTDDQAAVIYNNIVNYTANCPYLRDRILNKTMGYMKLQSDADARMGPKHGNIYCLTGGCSANALRGHSAVIVIMDEFAHFVKNNGRFSDTEVYKALTPSTSGFSGEGKKIILSSPYTKSGHFYTLYDGSFREPDTTLMFRMYSCMLNPYNIDSTELKTARRRDRTSFMCEFGGEFSDTITAWIEDPEEFKKCVFNIPMPSKGRSEMAYHYGLDLGFKNDGASIAICHKENKKIHTDHADVWFSGSSDVWEHEDSIYLPCTKYAKNEFIKMSDILIEIKDLVRWFPCKSGIFDQMTGYALQELLHGAGFKQFELMHFTDKMNHEVYQLAKRMYAEGLLMIPDHDVLIPELLSLEAERKSKQKIEVRAPDRQGAHDDISDSWVRAIWLCFKAMEGKGPNRAAGAGGQLGVGGGMNNKRGEMTETHISHMMRKRKTHGEHPRGLDKIKRRRPGAVQR